MSQFVVIGLGSFGKTVALTLKNLKNEVLVIDLDGEKIEEVKDYVTQAVVGDVTNKKMLSEFVSKDVDAVVVSLGTNMEASILTTLYMKDLGVKKILVKAMSEDHGEVLRAVGATEIIYPEKEVGVRVAERLSIPNLIDHVPLAPEYSIIEIVIPDDFVGKSLKELKLRNKYGIEVIAVRDIHSNKFSLIPSADFTLKPGCSLIIIARRADIKKLEFRK
jgi:trk system potassium uptake protein TrkA